MEEKIATKVVMKIMNKIKQLEIFPESGANLSSYVGFQTDYRFLLCNNYIIFYRTESSSAYIIRILCARRDYMRILFDIEDKE